MASSKKAVIFAPGNRNMTFRCTAPRSVQGRPVSRLMTVKPAENFPTLLPISASRNTTYAAPATRNEVDPEFI